MNYQLRFKLFRDAPETFRVTWRQIMTIFYSGEGTNDPFMQLFITEMTKRGIGMLEDRQILKRTEGGIGGDSNTMNRQIRVQERFPNKRLPRCEDPETIVLVLRNASATDGSKWSLNEIFDIGDAFKAILEGEKMLHEPGECVTVDIRKV